MLVSNPVCLNDWRIRRLFIFIFSMQISVVGLNSLESMGIHFFGIKAIIGFFYLTFVPGFLILRSLKIHNLNSYESLFYAVGLSVATIMFMGLLISVLLPIFGESYPLTTMILTITIFVITYLLMIVSFIRDRDFFANRLINIPPSFNISILVLTLLPIISVLGTTVMNQYGANELIILLLLSIFIIVILMGVRRLIPRDLFPYAILAISIALLFHRSLISPYLVGADIQLEYYLSNIVSTTAFWDINFHSTLFSLSNVHSMLSVELLAPTYSGFCGISLIWIFKAIYPLLFTIVPIALFLYVKKQTSDEIAFFSAFFFISFVIFFGLMPQLARQEIAELFVALIILLLVNTQMNPWAKRCLILIFLYSLVVSHYGMTYIFLSMIALGLLWLYVSKIKILNKIPMLLFVKPEKEERLNLLNPLALAMFGIVAFSWYSFTTHSSILEETVQFSKELYRAITYDLFNSPTTQGLTLMSVPGSLFHSVLKYMQLLMQFFIVVGFIGVFWKKAKYYFRTEYLALCLSAMVFLIISLFIPFVTFSLGVDRIYQICLIFLAPFCIIGALTFLQIIARLINRKDDVQSKAIKWLALILSLFFIFNTSLVYYATGEAASSISLSNSMDGGRFFAPEVVGMKWSDNLPKETAILADFDRLNLVMSVRPEQAILLDTNTQAMTNNSIIFLGKANIAHHGILITEIKVGLALSSSYINYEGFVYYRDQIYNSDQAEIYY